MMQTQNKAKACLLVVLMLAVFAFFMLLMTFVQHHNGHTLGNQTLQNETEKSMVHLEKYWRMNHHVVA